MCKTPLRLHIDSNWLKRKTTTTKQHHNLRRWQHRHRLLLFLSSFFFPQPFDVTSQSLEITNSDFTARKVAKCKEGERESPLHNLEVKVRAELLFPRWLVSVEAEALAWQCPTLTIVVSALSGFFVIPVCHHSPPFPSLPFSPPVYLFQGSISHCSMLQVPTQHTKFAMKTIMPRAVCRGELGPWPISASAAVNHSLDLMCFHRHSVTDLPTSLLQLQAYVRAHFTLACRNLTICTLGVGTSPFTTPRGWFPCFKISESMRRTPTRQSPKFWENIKYHGFLNLR